MKTMPDEKIDAGDIQKAIDRIQTFKKVGKVIADSQQQLQETENRLVWARDVCQSNMSVRDEVLRAYEGPVEFVRRMPLEGLTLSSTDSCAAITSTACNTASSLLTDYIQDNAQPSEIAECKSFLSTFFELSAFSVSDDLIRTQLNLLDEGLGEEYMQSRKAYIQWGNGFKTMSDLAKDMCNLLEGFKGELNKLRADKAERDSGNVPAFSSWKKMAEQIAKSGRLNVETLIEQGKIYEKLWNNLTRIRKEMSLDGHERASDGQMKSEWTKYRDHLKAVMDLIDKTRI